jgi:hypothetical protein
MRIIFVQMLYLLGKIGNPLVHKFVLRMPSFDHIPQSHVSTPFVCYVHFNVIPRLQLTLLIDLFSCGLLNQRFQCRVFPLEQRTRSGKKT